MTGIWLSIMVFILADMLCFFLVASQHKKIWHGLIFGSGFYLLWKHGAK
jgi:hypothetical protein